MKRSFFAIGALVLGSVLANVACSTDDGTDNGGVAGAGGGLFTPGTGGSSAGGSAPSSTCGPTNCAGCCMNNVCQMGNTVAACGTSGATCATCTAPQICTTARTCAADVNPDSMWRVQPATAKVAANPLVGQWDGGDDTIPEVMAFIDCKEGGLGVSGAADEPKFLVDARTDASAALSPMWSTIGFGDCTVRADALLARPVAFRLFDDDSGLGVVADKDAITNVMTHQVTSADLNAGQFTIPATGLMSGPMTVKLIREP